jgi:hypothetical protein
MAAGPRAPVAAKTQAAGLGAGLGAAIGSGIVGLLQTYVTHQMLPYAAISLIGLACAGIVAWLGAYFAPHQPRPADTAVADQLAALREELQVVKQVLGDHPQVAPAPVPAPAS